MDFNRVHTRIIVRSLIEKIEKLEHEELCNKLIISQLKDELNNLKVKEIDNE